MNATRELQFYNFTSNNTYRLQTLQQALFQAEIGLFGIFTSFALFGIINNLVLLTIILRKQSLRTGSGILIAHLFFTYFIMCSVPMPANAVVVILHAYKTTYTSITWCNIVMFTYYCTMNVANWTEAALAVNRFVAIAFPQQYRAWTSKKAISATLVWSWVAAILQTVPMCSGLVGDFKQAYNGICAWAKNDSQKLALQVVPGLIYLPYLIIGMSTVGILSCLLFRKCMQYGISQEKTELSRTMERRLATARMLLVSFIWCCSCYFPISIMAYYFDYLFVRFPTLNVWLRTSVVAQYTFNAFIFYAMSAAYRKEFKTLIGWRKGTIQPGQITGAAQSQNNGDGPNATRGGKSHYVF